MNGSAVKKSKLHRSSGLTWKRLQSWAVRGGIALFDQGLFSGSNFLMNILLARWLLPADYGAFSVAYSISLFLSGFHNAILLEPMSIIGPANYADRMSVYLDRQIRLHFSLTIPLGLLISGSGAFLLATELGDPWLARALFGTGLALPFMLFLWTVRRMFYIVNRPSGALFCSCAYAVILIAGLWLIHDHQMDSALLGFGLMGFASLLSGVLALFGWKITTSKSPIVLSQNEIFSAHWNFGKWALAAAMLNVAAGQAQIFITAGMVNLEASGVLRALQNFMLPMAQIVTAIATLGLPAMSYDFGRGGLRSLRRKGLFITLTLTSMAVFYGALIWWLVAPLEQMVYSGKYAAYLGLIAPLGLVPVFTALATGFSLILRSLQKTKFYLFSSIVTGVTGLASSLLFTKAWGLTGAVFSIIVTYLMSFLTAIFLYRAWFPHKDVQNW